MSKYATVAAAVATAVTAIIGLAYNMTNSGNFTGGDGPIIYAPGQDGDNVINIEKGSPGFRIDLHGNSLLKPGEAVVAKIASDRMQNLNNATCSWRIEKGDDVLVQQVARECELQLGITSVTSIDSSSIRIFAVVSDEDGESYSATTEVYVSPDVTSEEFRIASDIANQKVLDTALIDMEGYVAEIAPSIDSTKRRMEEFKASMRAQSIGTLLVSNPRRVMECDPTGCRLETRRICEARARTITIQSPGTLPVTSEIDCDPAPSSGLICLVPPFDIPRLTPNAPLTGSITFAGAPQVSFNLAVAERSTYFDPTSEDWMSLDLLKGDAKIAPFVAARHNPTSGIQLFVGTGGEVCHGARKMPDVDYDTDGKGFISTSTPIFTVQIPANGYVDLRISESGDERVFRYALSAAGLAEHLSDSSVFRLNCRNTINGPFCSLPRHDDALTWANVRRIIYGSSSSSMDHSYNVDIDATEAVGPQARTLLKNISFQAPKGWEDVFYQLEFKNGTRSRVERIPL